MKLFDGFAAILKGENTIFTFLSMIGASGEVQGTGFTPVKEQAYHYAYTGISVCIRMLVIFAFGKYTKT